MDLDHIKAKLFGFQGGGTEGGGDSADFFRRERGNVRGCLIIQQTAQFLVGKSFCKNVGKKTQHALPVGVRLMQLGADQAAMFMGGGCQPAVVSGPFAGKK